jgi:hypothetical protein
MIADFAGYPNVAALLELNQAEKIEFIERTTELVGDRLREELRGRAIAGASPTAPGPPTPRGPGCRPRPGR